MQRTYIKEGFAYKEQIKRRGGRFDNVVKLWYFTGTDARSFTPSGYVGYIERRNSCRGRCFIDDKFGCGACDLPSDVLPSMMSGAVDPEPGDTACPVCGYCTDPMFLESHDACIDCDISRSRGEAITPGEEVRHRRTGGKPRCRLCGKNLVPTGQNRANGSTRYNDHPNRDYHIECYKEELRNQ